MIESISKKLAHSLKAAIPDHPYSEAKLTFGIHLLLNTVLTIGSAVVLGALSGRLADTMISLFAFALLRAVSGGYHFKSALICVIVSSATAAALPFIPLSDAAIIGINILNILLILIYAPSRIDGQTRIPKRHYPKLKIISLVIASTNFLFASPLLALTWLVQSISLIRLKGGESK
ncbi:MAG: post-translational modification of quorum-sensing peptide protein [Cohnella sp.]|jgi:accessory gene regulator B|uniref:accessory gene regulator ArgB-like protein n=1 Tax=Cohnella sp. TaxID=1883426 RepID=UPI000E3A9D6D|nr:accessory gene regulator B family protein [Cohnella sp.]REK67497.1 MAG: post-translational modification of quorum-sensing peptide protein [Cohnella sp.]